MLSREDLFTLYSIVVNMYADQEATGLGLVLLGDLIVLMETNENDDNPWWKNQELWEIMQWRLYSSCGVVVLELENGFTIYVLVDQMYPLTTDTMERLLSHGLQVMEQSEIVADWIRWFSIKLHEKKNSSNK